MYIVYAAASAVFAGLTAVLAKIGVKEMDSTLATAVRTVVVAVFAWLMAWITGAAQGLAGVSARTLVFLVLSGLATGASWLCFYRALQLGPASVVVPIDKLSLLVTVACGCLLFRERLEKRAWLGLGLITAGTVAMAFL